MKNFILMYILFLLLPFTRLFAQNNIETKLFVAAKKCNPNAVNNLIKEGIDVNAVDKF